MRVAWIAGVSLSVLLISSVPAAPEPDTFIPDPPPAANRQPQAAAKPTVTIELAEWDALKDELRALKAENAELRRKLDQAPSAPAPAPAPGGGAAVSLRSPSAKSPAIPAPAIRAPRRSYTQIEVGMTRQDVDLFIKTHKDFRIVSVRADSGVRQQAEETVVRRDGTSGYNARRAVGVGSQQPGPAVVDDGQVSASDESRQVVERKFVTGKRETIVVEQVVSRRVPAGQQRTVLGGMTTVYRREQVPAARLIVELTDDVVTAVSGSR